MIDPKLLEILGCPLGKDRPPLRQDGELLICTSCTCSVGPKAFPVVDNIPHLLPEDAIDIPESVK